MDNPESANPPTSRRYITYKMEDLSGGKVAVVSIEKKPRNMLTKDCLEQLIDVIDTLENNASCRGLILTSGVPGIFTLGLDLAEFIFDHPKRFLRFWPWVQAMFTKLYYTKLVTVAAINGIAPLVGCVLGLACDYRIMMKGPYEIGLNETQLKIHLPGWVGKRFSQVVGTRTAEYAGQLGTMFSPDEALRIGLVDEVCDEDEVMTKARTEIEKWLCIKDEVRVPVKQDYRRELYDDMITNKEAYVQKMADMVGLPCCQEKLKEIYSEISQATQCGTDAV